MRARPRMDTDANRSTASGKMVNTSTRSGATGRGRLTGCDRPGACRSTRPIPRLSPARADPRALPPRPALPGWLSTTKRKRDKTTAIEDEQVAGRVGLDLGDRAEKSTLAVFDPATDEVVDPEHVGVGERAGQELGSPPALGVLDRGHALEVDDVAVLVRPGRGHPVGPAIGVDRLGAGLQPLRPIRGQVHDHVAA